MNINDRFQRAFLTRDIETFLALIFPPEWKALQARIVESGATFSEELCPWAPRWSKVPPTVRVGKTELETQVKSCIYRAHDCLHQLWGLPHPDPNFTQEGFYVYKRSQMCGEVAVLTLTEFVLCAQLLKNYPELKALMDQRNAIAMLEGPLKGRSVEQIAARLDTLLHKKFRPAWVRSHSESMAFCDDYVPMLQYDRDCIDHNWELMRSSNWCNSTIPNAPYSQNLDGLELTQWMVRDFYHQMDTGSEIDKSLTAFNRHRREGLILPKGWNQP